MTRKSSRGGVAGPPPPAHSDPVLAHLVEQTEGLQPWRRVFHAVNGIVTAMVLAWVLPTRTLAALGLSILLTALLVLDVARLRSPGLNRIFFRVFRPFASPREERRVASSTWYVAGILLAVLLFPIPAVIPGVLVLALADPAAGVVGRRWGRHRLGTGSVEGSLTFAVVAFLVLWIPAGATAAVVAAVAAAAVEVLPLGLDDNLTVPLVVAGVLALLGV